MYATLSQFKNYLWIASTDTTNDEILTLILASSWQQINKICGVDSFLEADYTETIDARKIYINSFWYNIFLKNKPVTAIKEIDGETYSGVQGTDYMIAEQRRAIFKSFDSNLDFGFFTIKYTAWYESTAIPNDLTMIEIMIACGNLPDALKEQYHVGISSYKLWDEQITFGAKSSSQSSDDLYFSFTKLLDKYKNFTLAI